MVSGWIIANNGLAFNQVVAGLVGAVFDEGDWADAASGLADTKASDDRWLTMRLAGPIEAVEVSLARSQAAPVLFIKAAGATEVEAIIQGVIAAMERYWQAPPQNAV